MLLAFAFVVLILFVGAVGFAMSLGRAAKLGDEQMARDGESQW